MIAMRALPFENASVGLSGILHIKTLKLLISTVCHTSFMLFLNTLEKVLTCTVIIVSYVCTCSCHDNIHLVGLNSS